MRSAARSLHEVSLHESIRYGQGDHVERWLNELLCLDCLSVPRIISGCPLPQTCDLYPLKVDFYFHANIILVWQPIPATQEKKKNLLKNIYEIKK